MTSRQLRKSANQRATSIKGSKSLEQLLPGETAIIQDILDAADDNSLMEMGLTRGTPVRLVKFSPLGDPLELKVRGYHLSIRRSEARSILVGAEVAP